MSSTEINPATELPPPPPGLDPAFRALSLLRRRRLEPCISQCTEMLERNPYDLQVWYMKTRALTLEAWVDDTEVEEDGIAEVLLDENAMASAPRPGTSLNRPLSTAGASRSGRPMSTSGRPMSGFARPGTTSRSSRGGVEGAFQGSRPGTTRPVTTSGRFVRLGTASLASEPGGAFINPERMDFKKYAERQPLAKVLCDYLLYADRNPRRAMELCAEATQVTRYNDWWWKARLGKCYYQLGLLRDAERQFKSSIKQQENIATILELGKVYYKLDQPLTALELFEKAAQRNPRDHHLLLGMARIYDLLNDPTNAVRLYKNVLELDSSNVEAIACIGSSYFYADQPEVAIRTFRRLLQMGLNTTELWNNLGLSCFYASQYDMALSCLDRALSMSGDKNAGDVWYNIGQVAIGIGDANLAYQAFRISADVDPDNAEALNNLAILELRKGNTDTARNHLSTATTTAALLHEPWYNLALLNYKLGEFQLAYQFVSKALEAFPDHSESLELKKLLRQAFNAL